MQSSTEVTYGDVEYRVTTFPAFKGLTYLQKLLKIVGPAIGEIFSKASADSGNIADLVLEEEALAFAIKELTTNLDKENVAQLVQDMIKDGVTQGGQPVNFNQQFSGNYGDLIKLIGVIVKDNYSSFFRRRRFRRVHKPSPTTAVQKRVEEESELDWLIWRLVTAERLNSSLIEVQSLYTVEDIYDAHEALDVYEALESEADAKAKAEANKGK